MEMKALDVLYRRISPICDYILGTESYVCGRPKGEVNDPQGVTEDVCFAVATLVCDRIGLSEDEGMAQVGKGLCALDLSC